MWKEKLEQDADRADWSEPRYSLLISLELKKRQTVFVYTHLVVSNLLVKRAPVVHQKGVALDVLRVGPRALVGFVALVIVYCHLQHKHQSSAFSKIGRQLVTSAPCCSGCQSAHSSTTAGNFLQTFIIQQLDKFIRVFLKRPSSKANLSLWVNFYLQLLDVKLSILLLSYWVIHRSQLTNFILHENYRFLFDSPQSYIWGCCVAVCTRLYGHRWTPSYTALQSFECWSHLLSVSLLAHHTCTAHTHTHISFTPNCSLKG